MNTYKDVVQHFGSKSDLAKSLGISPAAVSQWNGVIPKTRDFQIESLTSGKFKANKYRALLKKSGAA